MQREIAVRLVPLNSEVSKLMALHELNPLINMECKLSASVISLIESLKNYITKGINTRINSIIGYQNEIKLAPEMELVKEAFKSDNTELKLNNEDDRVIIWSETTAKGLILKDLYILMNFHEPLYLYYYWDAEASSENYDSDRHYYKAQRTEDNILDRKEYEDFIEIVANVVQNVLSKKKINRHKTHKRSQPEAAAKLSSAQEDSKLKASPASEFVYDMDDPFKSIFERPRPQTVDPIITKAKMEERSKKKAAKRPKTESMNQVMDGQSNGGYYDWPLLELSEIVGMDKRDEVAKIDNNVKVRSEDMKLPHPNDAFKHYKEDHRNKNPY